MSVAWGRVGSMERDRPGLERELEAALWTVRGISARAIDAALAAYGSLAEACALPRGELADVMGLKAGGRANLQQAPADLVGWIRGVRAQVEGRGGRLLVRGDPDFPDFGSLVDPPAALWCRGSLAGAGLLDAGGESRAVSIVGTRKADLAAVRLAKGFAIGLVREGFTVVSGGALGTDGAAHQGALEGGGPTVAVLGSGVLRPLPARNRRIFARLLDTGGGLVSELPPLEGARAEHFPRRNRLIAGLARALVVVRAAAGSGTLHTARAARALGREIFVVPAPELGAAAAGGEELLAAGATPVRSPDELLAALAGRKIKGEEGGGDDERILAALSYLPASVAELAAQTGLASGVVAQRVTALCVAGKVASAGPGRFSKKLGA